MSAAGFKSTVRVAFFVCLVCSVLVVGIVSVLRSIQERNKVIDKMKNILAVAGLMKDGIDVEDVYSKNIDAATIEIKSGEIIKSDDRMLDPAFFNLKDIVKNDKYSVGLSSDEDVAKIIRKPRFIPVYFIKNSTGDLNNEKLNIKGVVLPIYGKGLWSTLYGFIALSSDFDTVNGITFYQHGETPGLGGEVDNPLWKAKWNGKKVFDGDMNVKISVVKGFVESGDKEKDYKVDGLSGATITTRGVDKLVRFWLSGSGYKMFLTKLKKDIV